HDAEQKDADFQMAISRRRLGINIEGWVPLDRYEKAKELNRKLKSEVWEEAETELERNEIQNYWPFDDRDEEGQS
ncbi:MAG: hypothetical protein Q9196_007134, partial [Gyalolechia fulgens]